MKNNKFALGALVAVIGGVTTKVLLTLKDKKKAEKEAEELELEEDIEIKG